MILYSYRRKGLVRNNSGFSLVELLIAMSILLLVIAMVSDSFVNIISQSGKQSSLSETEIEGLVGLEVLRSDLESAGFGLPWAYPAGGVAGYNEVGSLSVCGGDGVNPAHMNDTSTIPPRPILGANNRCLNGSDYLVIKATSISRNETAQKWTYIEEGGPKVWGDQLQDFQTGDRIILIGPKVGENILRRLLVGSNFWFTYPPSVSPSQIERRYVAYGLNSGNSPSPKVPFNRADYYISDSNVPSLCASNTGVLRKAVMSHGSIDFPSGNLLPLLDCVADFQVIFGLDMNEDGTVGTFSTPDGSTISTNEGSSPSDVTSNISNAEGIRKRLKEIRVYILAHEGGIDMNFNYSSSTIEVGEFGLGKTFNLTTIPNYQRYRWKVLKLFVKPKNFG